MTIFYWIDAAIVAGVVHIVITDAIISISNSVPLMQRRPPCTPMS